MNIFKQILIFTILMVNFACSHTSEDEAAINSVEYIELETISKYPELMESNKYQTLYKKSLKTEPSFLKGTENADGTEEPGLSYFEKFLNKKLNKRSLYEDESKPNYEVKSDYVNTEEIGTKEIGTNKTRSESLKDNITKDNQEHISSSENEKIDSSDNKHENQKSDLEMAKLLNIFEKFETDKNFRNFQKNLNNNERAIQEQIFKMVENNGKVPVPVVPLSEFGFRVLIELDINPFHLFKRENPKIAEDIKKIYEEFIILIDVDIQSNIFPLGFYQTVSPIIEEYLLPLLEVPSLKQKLAEVDKDYKFPGLFLMLNELIEIPKNLKIDYTISNFFKILDKDLKKMVKNDNEGNKMLMKLYKKNVEHIQNLLNKDWKENEAPLNFIKFIYDYSVEEKYLVIGGILNQILTQKHEQTGNLKRKSIESFLLSFDFSWKDEL